MRLYLTIVAIIVFIVSASWLITRPTPGPVATPTQTYPWQIEQQPDGATRVFGLVLGTSTLAEARHHLGAEPGVQVFATPDKTLALEAYFERVTLGGLTAKVVLGLALDEETLQGMAKRSPKHHNSPSGSWRLDLAEQDAVLADSGVITTISYLPSVRLDKGIVAKLFGMPGEKITSESDDGEIQHWLYPAKGLDITLHQEQKEVLQYIHPSQFARLRSPLAQ